MRIAHLIAGFFAAILLLPVFMKIWAGMTPKLVEGITNPFLLLFYTIVPYIIPIIIVIAAFIVARGRRNG